MGLKARSGLRQSFVCQSDWLSDLLGDVERIGCLSDERKRVDELICMTKRQGLTTYFLVRIILINLHVTYMYCTLFVQGE